MLNVIMGALLLSLIVLDIYVINLVETQKHKKLRILVIILMILFIVSYLICFKFTSSVLAWLFPFSFEMVFLIISMTRIKVSKFVKFFCAASIVVLCFGYLFFCDSGANIDIYKSTNGLIDMEVNRYPLFQYYEQEDGDYCIEMADEKGNFSFNTYADKVCIGATTEDLSYVKEETRYWENDIQEKTYTIFIAIN